MFTFEQIKELMALVARHRLQSVTIERSGFVLRIEGGFSAAAVSREMGALAAAHARPEGTPTGALATSAPLTAAVAAVPPATASPEAAEKGLHLLASPIVGTFYASPSPESPAYARVGDRVRKGQVLCIVEAMKLMNEIESDVDGVVAEIYPKNAQPVEFGEPLFGIRAD